MTTTAIYTPEELDFHAELQAADLFTLLGAHFIAVQEANKATNPDDQLALRRLATNINLEISRR